MVRVLRGLILLSLRGRPLLNTWGPAGILAANAMVRGGLKVRERLAEQAGWPTPVGRQHLSVRITFGLVGLALGFAAGWWIMMLAPVVTTLGYKLLGAGTLAATEAVRNVVRIGGKHAIAGFKLEEHQVVLPE